MLKFLQDAWRRTSTETKVYAAAAAAAFGVTTFASGGLVAAFAAGAVAVRAVDSVRNDWNRTRTTPGITRERSPR